MNLIRLEKILEWTGIGRIDEQDATRAHCEVKHKYHTVDSITDATAFVLAGAFVDKKRHALLNPISIVSVGLHRRSMKLNVFIHPVWSRRHQIVRCLSPR